MPCGRAAGTCCYVLDDLFDYALRTFSADAVVRFLGHKFQPYKAEVESSHKRFSDLGDLRTQAAPQLSPHHAPDPTQLDETL